LLAQNFLKISKLPIIVKIFMMMGYIELFVKKIPRENHWFS